MPAVPDAAAAQLQIGVVAEQLGLSVRTLHHWEEQGLVTPSARSAGGFRLYTAADVDRLRTIRRMKPLGFTLEEMRRLLDALQVLDEPGSAEAVVAEAGRFLTACRARVEESREHLRRQLDWAEEFAALLEARAGGGPEASWSGSSAGSMLVPDMTGDQSGKR